MMNFFRTLLNCCAGFQFYRTRLELHPLDSIRFLACVILLMVVVQIGTFVPVLQEMLGEGAEWIEATLPRFEIKGGKAHYTAEQPFVYTNDFIRIILDTSGQADEPPYTRPYGLFIGRDKVQFGVATQDRHGNLGSARRSEDNYRGYPDGIVNGEYARKLSRQWLWRYGPLAMLLYFFFWLLLVLVQAYLFTLVISVAESATLKKFGFNQFFNLAAHACTPAVIVVTALIVSRMTQIDFLMMAFLVTYFIYILGATAACRRDEGEEKEKDSDETF
jgi:hypothetical protein